MQQPQQGFLLNRHSKDNGDHTEIRLWLTTPQGPARLLIEHERPLFFVEQRQQETVYKTLQQHAIPFEWRSLELTNFAQQRVAAVYFSTIQQHIRAQELLATQDIEVLEGDIRLHDRYLMERFAGGSISFIGNAVMQPGFIEYRNAKLKPCDDYLPEFKVLSLDIECAADGQLYSIGLYSDTFAQVLMIGSPEPSDTNIHWVADELALLYALESIITRLDPDIIIGWSVVSFDFRLLIKRAEHHRISFKLGRGKRPISWRDARYETNRGYVTVPGRVVIDGIDALKNATYTFDSFSLEFVSQKLLGRGKKVDDVDHRLQQITDDFRHNKPKLAAYNLEDCRLVWDIFEHTQILDFLRLRGQLTGLELDRNGGWAVALNNLYLPRLHRAGYVAPNLPKSGGLTSPGGYVMDSRPGLYKNVLVLDFKSLYPSIIRTFKIDPLGLLEGLKQPQQAIEGFSGAVFSRDKHILPGIITELWQQRDEAKKIKDQPRSQALKILMNSFYGLLGTSGCRFCDSRLTSSITLRGHAIIQQTTSWIEAQGYQVIYGDTDSIFIWLEDDYEEDQVKQIAQQLAVEINQRWNQKLVDEFQLDNQMEIEFEIHFRRFLMPTIRGSDAGTKKRYAGLSGKGENERLIFKGLETVRTDWSELAKQFQQALYEKVFKDQDPTELIRNTVDATLNGERDHQLVYRKRLRRRLDQYVKNVPPHVRAARLADYQNKKRGKSQRYQNKGWISYVITVAGPEPVEYQTSPIDYQHYIDKQIKPVAEAILPFIGLDFAELISAQTSLF